MGLHPNRKAKVGLPKLSIGGNDIIIYLLIFAITVSYLLINGLSQLLSPTHSRKLAIESGLVVEKLVSIQLTTIVNCRVIARYRTAVS